MSAAKSQFGLIRLLGFLQLLGIGAEIRLQFLQLPRERAGKVPVAGTVIGSITVDDKLEIGASARLRGRVSARRIAIALGAQIEGEVVCTSAEPIVEFTEKRTAEPQE